MPNWRSVGAEATFVEGSLSEVTADGSSLLIARTHGTVYAVDGRCPHLGGHLARGTLNEFVVTCPLHGSQFDVRDGRNIAWITQISGLARKLAQTLKKPQDLRAYPVRIQDGQVQVELP